MNMPNYQIGPKRDNIDYYYMFICDLILEPVFMMVIP